MKRLASIFLSVAFLAELVLGVFALPSPAQAAATLTFLQLSESGEFDTNTHTFSSENIGTASSDRIVFVVVHANGATDAVVSSITIGGISGTVVVQANDITGLDMITALGWAAVPTGTSADVVVVFTDDDVIGDASAAFYAATGIGTSPTPLDTATALNDAVSMTIDVSDGGILIGGATFNAAGAISTTGVTERYDTGFSDSDQIVGGEASGLTAESNRSVIFDGASGDASGVAASYAAAAEEGGGGAGVLVRPPNNLGLVGYWSFNEGTSTRATDFSGNGNYGTLSTTDTNLPEWVVGKRGTALEFDNTNYVETTFTEQLTNFTACAWYYAYPTLDDYERIFEKNYETGFWVGRQDSGIPNSWGGGVLNSSWIFVTLSDGAWHHICARRSGTTFHIIGDGGAVSDSLTVDGSAMDTTALRFGADVGSGALLDGKIDDARIYNRALSDSEIAALYRTNAARQLASSKTLTNGSSLEQGLVGLWTFDGGDVNWTSDSAGVAYDRSGNNNVGTLTNMTRSFSQSIGKLGQALRFDNANDLMTVASHASLQSTGDVSVALWVYADSLDAGDDSIIGQDSSWNLSAFSSGNHQLCIEGGTTGCRESSADLGTGAWHHIVGTYTASTQTINLYLDGATNNGSVTGTVPSSRGTGTTVQISGTSFTFDGRIDDIRIYHRTLSASEVLQLYRLGQAVITP